MGIIASHAGKCDAVASLHRLDGEISGVNELARMIVALMEARSQS